MISKSLGLIKSYPLPTIIIIISTGIIGLNVLAYNHAYAMLHFTPQGERTAKPEALSIGQKATILLTGVTIPKPVNDSTPADWNLPYQTHRFQVDDRIELEAWYIPHPQARGLVLMFHGYAAAKSSLLPEAQAFHEMGYATFLLDFRGSGGSNQQETSLGVYEAGDVAVAFDYAQKELPNHKLILYGQSMGGVALLRAISEKGIKPERIIIEAVFDRMLSTVENRFASMGLPSFPGAQILLFWGGVINGHSAFKHNPLDYAAQVNCPVLMLHGTDDKRATLEQAQAVFEEFKGEKHFETFTDTGHESYLGNKPGQWQNVVQQFLGQ